MTSDLNKGITGITYNHLNLPTQVYWAADKKIDYLYNAAGQKVKKTVRDGNTQKVVDYLDGFQYAGGVVFQIGTFLKNQNIGDSFSVYFRKYFRYLRPTFGLVLSFIIA